MGNSAIQDILVEDEEDKEEGKNNNSFPESINALGSSLFKKYPDKTSNLSQENINGIIRAQVLNNYMEQNFGYRYGAIDQLVKDKKALVVSHNGLGITSLIELLKSIQASFEQTQIPSRVKDLLGR